MGVYVYGGTLEGGLGRLVDSLGATFLRKHDGQDFWKGGKRVPLKEGDQVVCWGKHLPQMEGVKVLNAGRDEMMTAIDQIIALDNGRINIFPYRHVKPPSNNTNLYVARAKVSPGGGMDVWSPPLNPNCWTQKLPIDEEFRIHSFDGRVIKAGKKMPKEGFRVGVGEAAFVLGQDLNPWIRSEPFGWEVKYGPLFLPNAAMKKIAHQAVKALRLNFGAVDVGMSRGYPLVIKVGRTPKLEGPLFDAYLRAIKRWMREGASVEIADMVVSPPLSPPLSPTIYGPASTASVPTSSRPSAPPQVARTQVWPTMRIPPNPSSSLTSTWFSEGDTPPTPPSSISSRIDDTITAQLEELARRGLVEQSRPLSYDLETPLTQEGSAATYPQEEGEPEMDLDMDLYDDGSYYSVGGPYEERDHGNN